MTEIVEVKDLSQPTPMQYKTAGAAHKPPVKLTGTTLREIISQENTHLFSYWLIRKLREC